MARCSTGGISTDPDLTVVLFMSEAEARELKSTLWSANYCSSVAQALCDVFYEIGVEKKPKFTVESIGLSHYVGVTGDRCVAQFIEPEATKQDAEAYAAKLNERNK